MMKRCISFLLCIFLTAILIPWTVFATEVSSPEETKTKAGHTSITGTMNISNRQSGNGSMSFDAHLNGSEIAGGVFVALYNEAGQMRKVETYPAAESVHIQLEYGQETDCVKVMWLGDNLAPVCQAETVEAHVPEIYAKALDEEHIAETEIEVDGETVTTMYVDNEVIIEAAEGVTKAQIEELVSDYGGSIVGYLESLGHYQIELGNIETSENLNAVMDTLNTNELVLCAYMNTVSEIALDSGQHYPHDDWFVETDVELWNEDNPSGNNWGLEALRVPSAWQLLIDKYSRDDDNEYSTIPKMAIGVIDSMFDMENPSELYFTECKGFRKRASDVLATEITRQLASQAVDFESYKSCWHGTHVAGIIAAKQNNNKGIAGVCLNNNLYGVSIVDSKGINLTTTYLMKTALEYLIESAASNNGKKIIINYSVGDKLSASAICEQLRKSLRKNDFLIVTAAGNDEGQDALNANCFSKITEPIIKNQILVVGGASKTSSGYSFSKSINSKPYNYGNRIDVVAPSSAYSTVPPNANSSWGSGRREYKSEAGTSQASPYIAGVAALVWAANPSLSGAEVKQILVDAATIELEDDGKDAAGVPHKMINAQEAVELALHELYGEAIDANTGETLERINVSINFKVGTDSKTLSFSADGKFRKRLPVRVEDLKNIQYESFEISAEGYKNYTLPLSENTHKTVDVGRIRMVPISNSIPADAVYYNGHAYKAYDQSMTWKEAEEYCKALGGHLATITSQNEQEFVVNTTQNGTKRGYWLGGSDENQEGRWEWVTGEDWNYANWDSSQPDNYSEIEHYLHLYNLSSFWNNSVGVYKWNDLPNDNHEYGGTAIMGFVCEWEPPAVPADAVYFNGHAYKVFDQSMTWQEAESICESMGGHLVTITDEPEQRHIESMMNAGSKYHYWIGLTTVSGKPEWVTNEAYSYSHWAPGQPDHCRRNDGQYENYVQIHNQADPRKENQARFLWNDAPYDNTWTDQPNYYALKHIGFICEWE